MNMVPVDDKKTRMNKVVRIDVNVLVWNIMLDKLQVKCNLNKKRFLLMIQRHLIILLHV